MKILQIVLCSVVLAGCQKSSPPVEVDRKIEDLASSPIPEESSHEVDAWKALGVARIHTVPTQGDMDHRAALLDDRGKEVGSVEITRSKNWTSTITRVAGLQAKIEFGSGNTWQITDLVSGDVGQTKYDPETRAFSTDPVLNRLQQKFTNIIPLAMGTLHAIVSQERSDTAPEEGAGVVPFELIDPAKQALWRCTGSTYKGGAIWGTKSGCCLYAKYYTAVQCSNALCIGCCSYRACDAYCTKGDFGCVCEIVGRACE